MTSLLFVESGPVFRATVARVTMVGVLVYASARAALRSIGSG